MLKREHVNINGEVPYVGKLLRVMCSTQRFSVNITPHKILSNIVHVTFNVYSPKRYETCKAVLNQMNVPYYYHPKMVPGCSTRSVVVQATTELSSEFKSYIVENRP